MSDLLEELQKLLWFEWDPIGINRTSDWPDDEYKTYGKAVYRMLIEGRDHYAISEYLERSALKDIGVSQSGNHDAIAARAIEFFERDV